MSTFTKKQRHQIYKAALKAFDDGKLETGLCKLFSKYTDAGFAAYHGGLPEFNAARPDVNDRSFPYDWTLTGPGNAARRRCLLKCIRMSAPMKRKK